MTTSQRPPHVAKQAVDRMLAKRQETGAGGVGDTKTPEPEVAAARAPREPEETPAAQEPVAEAHEPEEPQTPQKPSEPEADAPASEEPAAEATDEPASDAQPVGPGAYFFGAEISLVRPRTGVEKLLPKDVPAKDESTEGETG
jgi:hypothetical protein